MPRAIRRVVTGHNAQGKAIFIADGPAPAVFDRGPGATAVTELWETGATPASNAGNADPTGGAQRLPPPKNGSKFRVVEYPPDSKRVAALHSTGAETGANAKSEGYVRDTANMRHPGFHKTSTIDYAVVLSGEIYALMDEGEVLLKAGDVLVQRGTNHAWSNRTEEPCCIAFVLIDADPV
ncbi:MAG: cupin domain-containing protein [Alphaproteobacteria bacterium]|nr:cupin domain-containing protein [Alphaproteobacteria bacterium]